MISMNFNSENMVLFHLLTSQKKQSRKKRTMLSILFIFFSDSASIVRELRVLLDN